jgi:hypothetical protein
MESCSLLNENRFKKKGEEEGEEGKKTGRNVVVSCKKKKNGN